MHDYHVHSNYSDGFFLPFTIEAAVEAGLDGVGFADHCTVLPTDAARAYRERMGFTLDQTYERRRRAIERLREETPIAVHDAVEMDYEPAHEERVATFLDEAAFDYAIGSVHFLDGVNVHQRDHFAAKSESERRRLVDRYFDKLVALIDSELFAVAAHLDLIERNPALRGFADSEQYDRVAAALADSRTVPEVNGGRVTDDYGRLHPTPAFFDALEREDVPVVVGTDSHAPEEIAPRLAAIRNELAERGIEPTRVH